MPLTLKLSNSFVGKLTSPLSRTLLLSSTLLLAGLATAQAAPADGEYHGEVSQINEQVRTWDQQAKSWISIDDFWQNWANNRDHKNWPSSEQYPIYDQVNELDTFLVKLDSGSCMMEFWHGRWRRANDVRRWDDKFNDYSACPTVFN